MYFYARFYYYFEQVNVGWEVIKVVLNLENSFGFGVIAEKERKMSASAFLMKQINEADLDWFEVTS